MKFLSYATQRSQRRCVASGTSPPVCGDARDKEAYEALLGDERADLIFTDPPTTFPSMSTSAARAAFATGNSRWASERCPRQSSRAFWNRPSPAAERCRDGPIAFVCMDWRHAGELAPASKIVFAELKDPCVWNKYNAGMGSFYRSKHELVFVSKKPTASLVRTSKDDIGPCPKQGH
jgi:hypothetical protein